MWIKNYLKNYTNQLFKNSKKKNVYAKFKDNILPEDLAEMGSLSSFNFGVKYLLCVIDVSTKYVWLNL